MNMTRRNYLKVMSAIPLLGTIAPRIANSQPRTDLIIAVQDNPPQLDPLRLTTNITYRLAASIYDTLIRIDYLNGERLVPGLAESWHQVDARTWDVVIRKGVHFHDGSVMTSEDVAYTFGPERMLTEGLPGQSISRQFFSVLEKVAALNESTVRFVTKQADPLFEFRLSNWTSQIISKAAFQKAGNWDKWALSPVGTGPYRVAEVKAGDRIRLVAHDQYWGGQPPFSSLTFKVMPEAASRVNALAAGDAHIITEVTPDQIATIKGHGNLDVVGGPINNIRCVNYGTFGGPLKDVRIRQALNLSIDREAIAKQLFSGMVDVPRGFQWQAYGDMFVENFPMPAYDPDAAKKLLSEAGYSGAPIEYRILANYYTAELDVAQTLQQMWQAVGINVQLKVCENWGQMFAQPNYAIFDGSADMIYPDILGSLWTNYGPDGFIRFEAKSWSNTEFDEIGKKLQTLTDRTERRTLHERVLKIFNEIDPPGTVLYNTPMLYGKRGDIAWLPHRTPMMDFGPFNMPA
ncbi:ABC transporter substrate-binding protein (plasmid) [Mesorhizobium sp. AR02]|uniref:ABC transporter substrate-binding protein n=1 Tax=Mesorhizobium sp. AR02 TaxID=2865837 RepID=UPI00215F5CF2|nr:ABC transporter substrate-binding protein [Mesorhizobium sp. AR02]UVK49671.1 ABC transporter substrate-binding protein [Mesorhizobium sp. AR02]